MLFKTQTYLKPDTYSEPSQKFNMEISVRKIKAFCKNV